jgi:hypothetical protein
LQQAQAVSDEEARLRLERAGVTVPTQDEYTQDRSLEPDKGGGGG